jgi:Ion channel
MRQQTLKTTNGELFWIGSYLFLTVSLTAKSIAWLFFSDGFVTHSAMIEVIVYNVCWIFVLSTWLGYLIARNLVHTAIAKIFTALVLLGLLCNWILGYAVLYLYFGLIDGGKQVREPITCMYFSIVTWTTLGYGDVLPSPEARLIAASEALFGYIWLAFFVGMSATLLRQLFEEASPQSSV